MEEKGDYEHETCLRRVMGECPDCKRDYNPEHHPNNLDCEKYFGCNF